MKVLITGGCGFIGSHFVEHFLRNSDYEIVVLDKLTYASSGFDRVRDIKAYDDKRVQFFATDITRPISIGVEKELKDVGYIMHLAAETHVDNSIKDPMSFVYSNVVGTANMLELARKIADANSNFKGFQYFSCYDEKTKALTDDGFKNYNELKEGDFVLSLNKETKKIEKKKIKKVIIQDYDGEMICFKGRRVDLKVTPNHRIYYKTYSNRNDIKIDEARNIYNRTNVILPNGIWKGKKENYITLKNIGKIKTKDLFYLCGFFIGDGFNAYQKRKIKSISGLSKEERIKKCRDPKSGRFISTEKIGENEFVEMNSYRIFFDVPENDRGRKRLEKTLSNLDIKWYSHDNKSGQHVYFSSKYWLNFFKQFGRYAKNKCIPKWMLEYDVDYLKCLFDGLIDSDGHRGNGFISYSTASTKLVRDVCELGFKLSRFPRIDYNYNESYIGGRKISGYGYCIYFPKRNPHISSSIQSKKHYKGKIWCVTVEDNKNLIVERNGKLAICGNTDEVFGPAIPEQNLMKELKLRQANIFPISMDHYSSYFEWDRYNSTNPYSGSKAAGEELCLAWANTYGLPLFITHCMNIFGERQHSEKYIPLCMRYILRGNKITIHSDPTKTKSGSRFYIHARNVANAVHFLMDRFEQREKYNIVGEMEVTNLELATKIADILEKPLNYEMVDFHSSRPGHDLRYSLSDSKLKRMGWEVPVTFDDSLEQTVLWSVQPENFRWIN